VKENSAPSPPQSRDSDIPVLTTTTKPRKTKTIHPPVIPHRHSASILIKSSTGGEDLHLLRTEISPSLSRSPHHHLDDDDHYADDEDDEVAEDPILTTTTTVKDSNGNGNGGNLKTEELFDSWYTPDFELGTWVLEHTKREGVRERWSMEF
jgi:hypothetical protein